MTVRARTFRNKKEEKSLVNLDKILEDEIGLGEYQLKAVGLCVLVAFFTGYSSLSYVFTAARIKTRCLIPECEETNIQGFSPPWIANAMPRFGKMFDNCHRFSSTGLSQRNITESCPEDLFDKKHVIQCEDYVYEHKNSAVYEFNLACDELRWFIIGSSLVVGTMFSLPLSGFISDRWGRRIALSFTMFNFAWINTITYFAGSYNTFVLGGFLGTLLGSSSASCANILALELVSSKHRMVTSSILLTSTALGGSIQGFVASTEPYWRYLILIIHVPMLVTVSFFWIAPESVRWLISKKRYDEAKTILIKAAKANGRVLSDETLKAFSKEINVAEESDKKESNSISLVFKDKTLLSRCIIALVWWFSVMFVTRGMKINSVGMSGNKFVNYISASAIHIPAYWISSFYTKRIGRKTTLIGGFWICAVSRLGSVVIPKENYGLSLAVYLLGKFCISSMLLVVYVYNFELFPTYCRTRLMTVSAVVGRLGFFLAPLTPALASVVSEHLPSIIFTVLTLVSGALVLLVPDGEKDTETKKKKNSKRRGTISKKVLWFVNLRESGIFNYPLKIC